MSDETRVTEYQSENGSVVKLSPGIVRQYLVSGKGNVSDQEVMLFLMLCKQQKLDPFQKDAYLIKYSDNDPATIVVGKDTFLKRAEGNADFRGFEAGVILLGDDGQIVEREGSFMRPEEGLPVGGWGRVYKEGRSVPYYASVSFEEYAGRKSDGDLNRQWKSKPATMIRKVALVQALREAFPKSFSGLYDQAEMGGEEPESAPRNVTPVRKVDKVDNRGRKVKPAQPSEDELVALEFELIEALDRALEDERITKKEYDGYQADAAKHVKAGDFSQYVSSVIARLPKGETPPESTEHEPEQPDLIDDPPIF